MIWLYPELKWQAVPSGRTGRPAVFSDAAIQFCLTLKCMFGLGLRQATGLAESLLKLAQFDWNVPDYSTLHRACSELSPLIRRWGTVSWSDAKKAIPDRCQR
jgi:hypothetical protein